MIPDLAPAQHGEGRDDPPTSPLRRLMLDSNSLEGALPPSLALALPALETLSIGNNPDLGGTLPTQLGLLGSTFATLQIDNAALSGTMPPELGALRRRRALARVAAWMGCSP